MTRKKKPVIGITKPLVNGRTFHFFTRLAVKMAKGRPRRITVNSPDDWHKYDGFIISGGSDINPELYGEAAITNSQQYDLERDALEQKIIRYAIENNKPLLGICRGMQLMNVALGGSLYQEASEVLEGFLPSNNIVSKIIGRREVMFDTESKLFKIMGSYTHYNVNSIHHQAVNKLGDGLRIVAKEENGLVQAIEQDESMKHPFVIGVQWHPELMLYTDSARRLFKSLTKAARG